MQAPLISQGEGPPPAASGDATEANPNSAFRYVSYGQKKPGGENQGEENEGYCSNEVITAKYTPANFTFKFLMEEFSKVANIYFLGVCLLQTVPQIR